MKVFIAGATGALGLQSGTGTPMDAALSQLSRRYRRIRRALAPARFVTDKGPAMPQIPRDEFERLPLRVHPLLRGVPLHDAWAVDLTRPHGGITLAEFLRCGGDIFRRPTPAVETLLSVRLFVGSLFGWDRVAPGGISESFAQRLTDDDRARSLVPPGTPHGLFRTVYRFDNEQLDEVINLTVHAAALSALVENRTSYRFYFAVYVRKVSPITPLYMAAIGPFRKWIVYPALLDGFAAQWNAIFGP